MLKLFFFFLYIFKFKLWRNKVNCCFSCSRSMWSKKIAFTCHGQMRSLSLRILHLLRRVMVFCQPKKPSMSCTDGWVKKDIHRYFKWLLSVKGVWFLSLTKSSGRKFKLLFFNARFYQRMWAASFKINCSLLGTESGIEKHFLNPNVQHESDCG